MKKIETKTCENLFVRFPHVDKVKLKQKAQYSQNEQLLYKKHKGVK